MWNRLVNNDFGLMSSLDTLACELQWMSPDAFPDFAGCGSILIFSDYSGTHASSQYECFSFLFVAEENLQIWETRRKELRRRFQLGSRSFAYKKLNDKVKLRALPDLLRIADDLNGICISILIHKRLRSILAAGGNSDYAEYSNWFPNTSMKRASFERLMRVVSFASFFTAGLVYPGQNVFWFSDEDEVVSGYDKLSALTKITSHIVSYYLAARESFMLGHLRCGTTASDTDNQLEDLAAIPDLVAGALCEALTMCDSEQVRLPVGLFRKLPDAASDKAANILGWLAERSHPLKRITFSIGYASDATMMDVRCVESILSPGFIS